MDIKGLLDVTCKTVANMIKGKTPEEIRKTFNIKNDFTEEEEAQVVISPIICLLWEMNRLLWSDAKPNFKLPSLFSTRDHSFDSWPALHVFSETDPVCLSSRPQVRKENQWCEEK